MRIAKPLQFASISIIGTAEGSADAIAGMLGNQSADRVLPICPLQM